MYSLQIHAVAEQTRGRGTKRNTQRQTGCALLAIQDSYEKTKQNKASDLHKTQWTLQGFIAPHFLNLDLIW